MPNPLKAFSVALLDERMQQISQMICAKNTRGSYLLGVMREVDDGGHGWPHARIRMAAELSSRGDGRGRS